MKRLSLVIPAYNEAESLPLLLDEAVSVCEAAGLDFEILVIDDGSSDDTFAQVRAYHERDARVMGYRFRGNQGKAAALGEGFRRAQGEYIITLDADLQDNPTEIPGLLAMLEAGKDVVSGWKKIRHDPWHKTLPSRFFNSVVRKASGLPLHDFNCGLKAYRAEAAKSLELYGEMHRYIPVLCHWMGFRIGEKAVEHRARRFGQSKYGLARLTNGMFDLMTLLFLRRFTRRPLHLFGLVGLLFSFLGFGILAFFAASWAVTGHLHVRPLLLGGMGSVIVGIQFVSFGLLGEMLNQRLRGELPPVAASTQPTPPVDALAGTPTDKPAAPPPGVQ